jgi:UBX domain-containing protein 7
MDDDAIAQVVMVTDTTPEKAAQYLTLADGDPDQAVTLYFENGGADLVGGSSSSTPATTQPSAPSRASAMGNAQNPINVDDDDMFDDDNPQITHSQRVGAQEPQHQSSQYEDDAAMARRLQEQMYAGSGANGEETVRAPLARQSETLLGPGADVGGFSASEVPAAVERQMQEMQRRRYGGSGEYIHKSWRISDTDMFHQARPGIFNQQPVASSVWNDDEDPSHRDILASSTGGASEASSRANRLAKLFQPPWDLMYKGPWDSAREEGREEKKWLLVNIQNGNVFDCQALNRDLWKDPSVVETVRENFLFLQYDQADVRAEQYLNYYFQDHQNYDLYPHIAIVDPRTGEQVKVWSRETPRAPDFLMQLHEFLDRYSLNNNTRNPVAKRKPEAKREKDIYQMSEEEQLQAAMEASLDTQGKEDKALGIHDPDDLTRSIGDLAGDEKGKATSSNQDRDSMSISEDIGQESGSIASPFLSIRSDLPHVEPAPGPAVTRIQFRHSAGRVIRRFDVSDPVLRIYEWLKAEPLEGKEGVAFELIAVGKNLMELAEETIEQAGLKNGTVMIEFLED